MQEQHEGELACASRLLSVIYKNVAVIHSVLGYNSQGMGQEYTEGCGGGNSFCLMGLGGVS